MLELRMLELPFFSMLQLILWKSLFLRDIIIKGESLQTPFDASLEWDNPYPSAVDYRNCFQTIESNRVPRRWSWLPLKAELGGLIGCYDAQGLLFLHTWYGENDIQWLAQTQYPIHKKALWLFFPMRLTELVSDLVVLQNPGLGPLSLAVWRPSKINQDIRLIPCR